MLFSGTAFFLPLPFNRFFASHNRINFIKECAGCSFTKSFKNRKDSSEMNAKKKIEEVEIHQIGMRPTTLRNCGGKDKVICYPMPVKNHYSFFNRSTPDK